MAEVSCTLLADDLCANRSQRGVHASQDAGVAFIRARRTMGLGKRRPPRAGAVLFLRTEEWAVTAHTVIHSRFRVIQVDPTEWWFSSFFSGDIELLWSQLLLPFALGE